MQGILDHNPDIDFTVDANYMSDNLCARYADDHFVLRWKTNIIINFRIIQAFFELLDEEYGTAFFSFRWILQFISVSKNKRHSEKRSDLSSSRITWIIRQTSLYLAKCLNLDFNQGKRVKYVSFNSVRVNRLDMFKGILYTILENSSSVISAQQDIQNKHMTAEYFKICAEIYEFIALLDGKVLDYEHAHDVKTTVIIPQTVFSTYMIRHYMLAAVHFPFDDPKRLVCFHKILMGLFFVNKVDLATFNYFYGEFYQCAKSINEQHFVTDYANFSLSGTFVNIIESVAQNHQHLKLLPSVLIRLSTNEVIVDSEFDPVLSNRHTYSKEAEKLKRKVRGSDYERDNVEMGENGTNNFIEFWRQLNER
ncbi:Ady4p [Kluyveromyces lactis]|uniref:KLLA0F13090p n=1 Tax=Kluyveromyces lactis (strain ATCC 8585 / CBS 2359 / DSM 70799 / NBRC 1267 / NRRL Y-1140 / WM37) TaxID=284590 RepID=Q6CK70_KLULA|nr:uncharacterized protein KLLA0_F13090g [Kluyveromyces lactis]CAG98377.1 KLLA0F13090p [Kluyveromyces lactis]|eukprot:XP_455669.1 uncharacterized protein KLLA0_F13090g [Kluyveromyces lactis]